MKIDFPVLHFEFVILLFAFSFSAHAEDKQSELPENPSLATAVTKQTPNLGPLCADAQDRDGELKRKPDRSSKGGKPDPKKKKGDDLFETITDFVELRIAVAYEQLEAQGRLPSKCKFLFEQLEKLGCGIENRVIFVKRCVMIKQRDQRTRTISDDPLGGTLFISDSLPQLQGDSLLFLSTLSPIDFMIVQVSRNLECKLIYGNGCKPDLLTHAETTIDSVGKIEVVGEGVFLLHEQKVKTISKASLWPRRFEFKAIADGKFEMKEK